MIQLIKTLEIPVTFKFRLVAAVKTFGHFRRAEENVEGHPGYQFNLFDSVKYYLDHGVPKEKMVVGMAFYGRGFELEDNEMNGLYCPARDGIPKAPFSRQIGIWGYDEIISAFAGLQSKPSSPPHFLN